MDERSHDCRTLLTFLVGPTLVGSPNATIKDTDMIETRIGLIALTAGMLLCMGPASTQTSQLVVGVDQAPACKDPATLQQLIAEKDKSAFDVALATAVQGGACTTLKLNQDVVVTGYSPTTKLMRIMPKGIPVQYWTSERFLATPGH
jgi:hypothetical protein